MALCDDHSSVPAKNPYILGQEGFVKFFADDGNIAAPFDKMCECINFINHHGSKFTTFSKCLKVLIFLADVTPLRSLLREKKVLFSLV